MEDIFVVDSDSAGTPSGCYTNAEKEPRLGYKNLASTASTITASHDAANVGFVYDGMTTMKWKPAVLESSIQFDGTFTNTDYVAIAGANFGTAGCSITIKDSGGLTLGSASGLRDNQPVFFILPKTNYTTIEIEFSCTAITLEVGEIYFGESMTFPRNVSVGYKPGRWSSNDLVTVGRTEANQFSGSTVRARGTTESFSINFVPITFMDGDYSTFMRDARGIPIFFLWTKDNSTQGIFGNWTASAPTFTSSLFSTINITINGIA